MENRFGCFLAVLLIAVAGCGGEKLYPVTGTVTVDGKPAEGLQVIFAADEGGLTGTGLTDAAGKYSIVTMKGKGLPAGTYRVSIAKAQAMSNDSQGEEEYISSSDPAYEAQAAGDLSAYQEAERQKKDEIPAKYNTNTILTATVAEVEENVIDFNLSTKD